jgi:hypothetical protein
MSKSIKSLFVVSLLALVSACGGANNAGDVEELLAVDPVPVTIEPTFSGKYN